MSMRRDTILAVGRSKDGGGPAASAAAGRPDGWAAGRLGGWAAGRRKIHRCGRSALRQRHRSSSLADHDMRRPGRMDRVEDPAGPAVAAAVYVGRCAARLD
jgi:hypothetical protein